jgi:hypothetical protein
MSPPSAGGSGTSTAAGWPSRSTGISATNTQFRQQQRSQQQNNTKHKHKLATIMIPNANAQPTPSGHSEWGALSTQESRALASLERTIAAGLKTFMDVGDALLQIRERRLYRGEFPTFEEYTRTKWGMTKTHANRLVAAAATVKLLGPMEVAPLNEAQVRPLTNLPPEQQKEAWEKVVADTGGGKITAAAVDAVVQEMLAEGTAVTLKKAPNPTRYVNIHQLLRDLKEWSKEEGIEVPKPVMTWLQRY